MRKALVVAIAVVLALSGCGRKKHARKPVPRPIGSVEVGVASWYGHPYHGRPGANGEIYDMEKLTAAHRTLPLGTWLRVQNLTNGKTVEVRITDRGPFLGGRIIDLSHAAARAIEIIGPGTAKVKLVVIASPQVLTAGYFAVQVGAFQDRARAERMRSDMEREFGSARLVLRQGSPPVWRVLVGNEPSIDAANALAERIRGEQKRDALVVRVDSD